MLAKERASDMYRLLPYFLSRTLSDLPMEWLLPTLFLGICYGMASLQPTAAAFFGTLASVLLIVATAQVGGGTEREGGVEKEERGGDKGRGGDEERGREEERE